MPETKDGPWASLVAQTVKESACNVGHGFDPWVWEKGMATRFSIPARRTPWTDEPGGLQSMGVKKIQT